MFYGEGCVETAYNDRTAKKDISRHTVSDFGDFGEVEINHIVWWMQFEPE